MNGSSSTYHRTLVKSVTYRAIAILADVGVVFALTGSINTSLAFGGIMVVLSSAIYFIHERVWARVAWGKVDNNH